MRAARRRGQAALAATACAAALCALPSAAATVASDPGLPFFGLTTSTDVGQLDAIGDAGIASLRVPVDWAALEPHRGRLDLTQLDAFVQAATEHGMVLVPILYNAPRWAAAHPIVPRGFGPARVLIPRDPAAFAGFAAALVQRYGPSGSFWDDHPDLTPLPIRVWQVWNEPNLLRYWPARLRARDYARLLVVTGRALHAADPGAVVLSAGIANANGAAVARGVPGSVKLPAYLHDLLTARFGSAVDGISVHPYADAEADVEAVVRRTRSSLRAAHYALPIWVTEFGWCTGSRSHFCTTPRGQADRTRKALRFLSSQRSALNIGGAFIYTWRDSSTNPNTHWDQHAGLVDYRGRPRPVLGVFSAALAAEP